MSTQFALIDCNNFFASCERLFRPDLINIPLVVLSSNDGCAVARSNEAKALGIKMGEPLHELKRRFTVIDGVTMKQLIRSSLPQVVAFSANFELYGEISRRVASVLARVTPRLELYSIDEAFLDIARLDIADYDAWGRALAAKVEKEVGIPVSVGIAPTKTLCKLAADHAKKHIECRSAFYIEVRDKSQEIREKSTPLSGKNHWIPGQAGNDNSVGKNSRHSCEGRNQAKNLPRNDTMPILDSYLMTLASVDIADIWGIGRRLAPRLRAEGIHTAADLAAMPPKHAQQVMGIHGRRTVAELNGISCIPLSSTHVPQQVISRGRQFGRDTHDFATIAAAIARMTNHACSALRHEGLLAAHATVWLMTNRKKPGFTTLHKDIHLYTPSADTGHITHQLLAMLEPTFSTQHEWHKAEVTLWDLTPDAQLQTDVFGLVSPKTHTHSTSLMTALDALNQKHGKGTVHYATEDLSHAWYPRRAMQSPSYLSLWTDVPIIKTEK